MLYNKQKAKELWNIESHNIYINYIDIYFYNPFYMHIYVYVLDLCLTNGQLHAYVPACMGVYVFFVIMYFTHEHLQTNKNIIALSLKLKVQIM